MESHANKIMMVTGSSSGIGRATALRLAESGADVIVHSRYDAEPIRELREQIEALGVRSFALFGDFDESGFHESFVQSAWDWQGRIDGWVNNAGGDVLTGDLGRRDLSEKLEYLVRVDVAATLFLSREIGQRMCAAASKSKDPAAGQFSIVNIGWDQAWQGMAGDSGELFAATKGSIMSMSKSLAQSLAPAVRVNCVAPGWIQTLWGEDASGYWDQRAKRESLMGRWGRPEDVANAVAWLVSEEASFVSGQVLAVNGGFRFSVDEPEQKERSWQD